MRLSLLSVTICWLFVYYRIVSSKNFNDKELQKLESVITGHKEAAFQKGHGLALFETALSKLPYLDSIVKEYDNFFKDMSACNLNSHEQATAYFLKLHKSHLKDFLNSNFFKQLPSNAVKKLKLLEFMRLESVLSDSYSSIFDGSAKSENFEIGHLFMRLGYEGNIIKILILSPALAGKVDRGCFSKEFRETFIGKSLAIQSLLAIKAAENKAFIDALTTIPGSLEADRLQLLDSGFEYERVGENELFIKGIDLNDLGPKDQVPWSWVLGIVVAFLVGGVGVKWSQQQKDSEGRTLEVGGRTVTETNNVGNEESIQSGHGDSKGRGPQGGNDGRILGRGNGRRHADSVGGRNVEMGKGIKGNTQRVQIARERDALHLQLQEAAATRELLQTQLDRETTRRRNAEAALHRALYANDMCNFVSSNEPITHLHRCCDVIVDVTVTEAIFGGGRNGSVDGETCLITAILENDVRCRRDDVEVLLNGLRETVTGMPARGALSVEHALAIRLYTFGNDLMKPYAALNNVFYARDRTIAAMRRQLPLTKLLIQSLRALGDLNGFVEDTVVYRSVSKSSSPYLHDVYTNFNTPRNTLAVNNILRFPTFTSTTSSYDVLQRQLSVFGSDIIYEIRLCRGHRVGVDISHLSYFETEAEVLLIPPVSTKVTGLRMEGTALFITLETLANIFTYISG